MNNRLIGDAGEYLVAYHLSRRGIAVALMNNGTKGVDLLGSVDLCCTNVVQQYIGSHININASDTILA
ncbi:hypothetical protein BM607_001070 [Shewanella sp. SACH]|uniref:hypothetical protein n=1 Tax=Shewanella sp. SACH TaxID=1873135 RepID=UPI00090337E0|nr:hypothetical protein [Shewanella sp. SACH]OUS52560.1 hypothetical protein BM607_001070 [Shewanella sp. SACH]